VPEVQHSLFVFVCPMSSTAVGMVVKNGAQTWDPGHGILLTATAEAHRARAVDDGEGNRWTLDFAWERRNALASARRTHDHSDMVNGPPAPSGVWPARCVLFAPRARSPTAGNWTGSKLGPEGHALTMLEDQRTERRKAPCSPRRRIAPRTGQRRTQGVT
jgi:hypothetical protein